MTVRLPPADPNELATFPVKVLSDSFPYTRIHDVIHEPQWFCACGEDRFDPPAGTSTVFGTCYLAGNPVGAFIEKFGDLPIVTRSRIDASLVAGMIVPTTRLADMTNRAAFEWGVTAELSTGDDIAGSQAWAERFFQAGFGGIWYTARHDPQTDLHSVALFGKPGVHPEAFVDVWSEPIGNDLVNDIEARFGFRVLPSSSLL